LQTAATPYQRPPSYGTQSFQTDPAEYPVSEPLPKVDALLQTSGEATYTDDIPSPMGTLHAAFVVSTCANGTIQSIDASAALAAEGVVEFFSAKDVPGNNKWGPSIPDEEYFATSTVSYCGQPIGLIVADTQAHADAAAKLVNVTYTNVLPPIITIDQAIGANSFFPALPGIPTQMKNGDVNSGFSQSPNIITGSVSCGNQYHFYMETQSAFAIPQEGGSLTVHHACQWPTFIQQNITNALGKHANQVEVKVRRCGGGYGGKITRNTFVAVGCALAADKLGVPVKSYVDINTCMEILAVGTLTKRTTKLGSTTAAS